MTSSITADLRCHVQKAASCRDADPRPSDPHERKFTDEFVFCEPCSSRVRRDNIVDHQTTCLYFRFDCNLREQADNFQCHLDELRREHRRDIARLRADIDSLLRERNNFAPLMPTRRQPQ